MLGQIINITVLKNPILTITHKTAHCTYGQACNPSAIVWGGELTKLSMDYAAII